MVEKSPPSALDELIEALRCLPSVGPRSAQRMAYYLLQKEQAGAARLARALENALKVLQHCSMCNALSDTHVCSRCQDDRRDASSLCVVEMPSDLAMIEEAQVFHGYYYVLMGKLSPLDGIGLHELGMRKLVARATNGVVKEVILATNFTNEGEATAHAITALLKSQGLTVSRLSRGMPVGGELEYVDVGTIAQALVDRRIA